MAASGDGDGGGRPEQHAPRRSPAVRLAAVIFALAAVSTLLTYTTLRSSARDADEGGGVTFSVPPSLAEPTAKEERSPPSDRLATVMSDTAARYMRPASIAVDAPSPHNNGNIAARSAADAPSPDNDGNVTRPGGMHLCSCLRNDDPRNDHLPDAPKRVRWLHIPKTGTSFISTLWSYAASTADRYIDLNINSHACINYSNNSYSMFDFALMRRYPWEVYGARNLIPHNSKGPMRLGLVGGTQHVPLSPPLNDGELKTSRHYKRKVESGKCKPPSCTLLKQWGSEVEDRNITVAAFFRQPEDRIVSAYYDGRHSSGFPPEVYQELVKTSVPQGFGPHRCELHGKLTTTNPLECFANFPGIAGCQTRMLTGESCADGDLQESGMDSLSRAIDLVMQHLDFVGMQDDWNESICQFHRLYMSKLDAEGKRYWDPPLQGEFSNKHKSKKKKVLGVEHLKGFKDVADTVLFEAVKLKFERMVGEERCYKYASWEELREEKQADDGALPFVKLDDDGNVCQPKTCSELGKQCGEWDDGCGRTIICGMCDPGRTGLPSTWRLQCVKGKCTDYCPPWAEKGYWFLTDESPLVTKNISRAFALQGEQHLSPVDAVAICEMACHPKRIEQRQAFASFVSDGMCHCGTTSTTFNRSLTPGDFSTIHDLDTMCGEHPARMTSFLLENDTQPICCPYYHTKMDLTGGWKRLFSIGSSNLEGEYFESIEMVCGAFAECEEEARSKKAEMAVFDMLNSLCHLVRNVVDFDDFYTVTKDNQNRFFVDLRTNS